MRRIRNNFITPTDLEQTPSKIDEYEVVLTTEKNKFYDIGIAFYISPFPGKNDRTNLRLMLDGFNNPSDVLSLFREDML